MPSRVAHVGPNPVECAQVGDAPGAPPLIITDGTVTFNDVSFSYDPRDTALQHAVLRNVTLTAPGGQTVALVGTTGSGKSSVLRMLLRFYDPLSGFVCIDGQDISTVSLQSLRRQIAVVPQVCARASDSACIASVGHIAVVPQVCARASDSARDCAVAAALLRSLTSVALYR